MTYYGSPIKQEEIAPATGEQSEPGVTIYAPEFASVLDEEGALHLSMTEEETLDLCLWLLDAVVKSHKQ